jgi:hypothetical protein
VVGDWALALKMPGAEVNACVRPKWAFLVGWHVRQHWHCGFRFRFRSRRMMIYGVYRSEPAAEVCSTKPTVDLVGAWLVVPAMHPPRPWRNSAEDWEEIKYGSGFSTKIRSEFTNRELVVVAFDQRGRFHRPLVRSSPISRLRHCASRSFELCTHCTKCVRPLAVTSALAAVSECANCLSTPPPSWISSYCCE